MAAETLSRIRYRPHSRLVIAALLFTLPALFRLQAAPSAQRANAPVTAAQAAQEAIYSAEWLEGGVPLTLVEQQKIRSFYEQYAKNAAAPKKFASDHQGYLALQSIRDKVTLERVRTQARSTIEIAPEKDDPVYQAINAHDPVVILDKAHGRVITVRTIQFLRAAASWVASAWDMPPLAASFAEQESSYLKAHYAELPPQEQQNLADAPRNWLAFQQYWDGVMDAAHRKAYVAANRSKVQSGQEKGFALSMAATSYPLYQQAQLIAVRDRAAAMRVNFDTLRIGLGNK